MSANNRLGLGKIAARKGARPWSRMMVGRLWGGLDDGVEVVGMTQ
jgi:hypothetical protein